MEVGITVPDIRLPEAEQSVSERAFQYYGSLKRVRHYVLQNLSAKITLASVARVARMERTYFSTFFRTKVGVSFRDWLRGLRVERAMLIMAECDEPVARVGRDVGFGQIRSFERAFKKTTHQTPIQYKREKRPVAGMTVAKPSGFSNR